MDTMRGGRAPAGGTVEEVERCLQALRAHADRAEAARLEGSAPAVAAAHAAGRALLDRISVALLAGGAEGGGQAGVLAALGASCAAEFARLEGRTDPTLWRIAAQRWQDVAQVSVSSTAAPEV